MDSLAPTEQKKFLLQTLEEAMDVDDSMDQMVDAWKMGDTMAMQKELMDGLKNQEELHDRILIQRNRRWTQKIEPLLNDGNNYLIVVGTLHLVGEDSLIKMLEDRGIDLDKVPF